MKFLNPLLICMLLFIFSCSDDESITSETPDETLSLLTEAPDSFLLSCELSFDLTTPDIDLNMNLDSLSLWELRILRNVIPARQGYLFMSSDLRHFFETTPWYTEVMENRWYGECEWSGLEPMDPISYSTEEEAFMDRVKAKEQEVLDMNYVVKNGTMMANIENIVNLWQFDEFDPRILSKLSENGFAIVPNDNVQFFHVYEQNDYGQQQNFVTTDMFLQLLHMQVSFMLRSIEEDHFLPAIAELSKGCLNEALSVANYTNDPNLKDAAEFLAAYFAVAYNIATDEELQVPASYRSVYQAEMELINNQVDDFSAMLPTHYQNKFAYSLFKPRGHYTRSEELQRYFKTMQWLQLAPLCMTDSKDLNCALLAAHILFNGTSANGTPLKELYLKVLDPTTFIIGKPDNISFKDVAEVMQKNGVTSVNDIIASADGLSADLLAMAEGKNVIKPIEELTCHDKINFMPARFVLDNIALMTMVDSNLRESKRWLPSGLDVFAGFGDDGAYRLLTEVLDIDATWPDFDKHMDVVKDYYSDFDDWDGSMYTKWLETLTLMLENNKDYPYFMQTDAWDVKNLNTVLGSWAELKHDAILYAEQPFAAECGGGGDCDPPPDPYVVGYVEPNIAAWQGCIEMLDLTLGILQDHGLEAGLEYDIGRLKELAEFLKEVSEKELRGEALSEQEYRQIEIIGTWVENLTLSIMDTDDWSSVQGPDKEVAIVADVYTKNLGNNAGILHVAVGSVYDIFVVTEIEGYLYITKGATFSYYEFPQNLDTRLTDEQWQQMIKDQKLPAQPIWLQDVLVPTENQPEPEVYVYSSGC